MNDKPLVSIVVNNYNYGHYLREAIDSALAQTYAHTEVIVVDDGSTDDSREIIAGYGDQVLAVLKENGGQASTFNAGFARSQGEIVIFLDADDYLIPRTVERVVAAWRPGIAKVQYRLKIVDALGDPTGFYPPLDKPLDRGNVLPTLFKRGTYVCPVTSGNGFGRDVLEQVLPAPENEFRISADGYLQVAVPFHGDIESIDEALGAYRIHGKNLYATEARRNGAGRDAAAFQRKLSFLQHKVLRHSLICYTLLMRKADELGHKVPPARDHKIAQYRIALLRLDPQDRLVSRYRPLSLIRQGLRAIWRHSDLGWRKRLIHSAWIFSVGVLPLPVAKELIVWMFVPEYRPGIVERLREKFGSARES